MDCAAAHTGRLPKLTDTKLRAQRSAVAPAYVDILGLGNYLNAPSSSTARRWVAELRARGLRTFRYGNRERFRLADVDKLLDAEAEI